MSPPFRQSRFIDFNEGRVFLDPETFMERATLPLSLAAKIDFFECRVEVFQLGIAAEMVKRTEASTPNSVWSQASQGLVSVIASYFEMIGKVLNPDSKAKKTSAADFDCGFCDVYPALARASEILCDADPYGASKDHVTAIRDLMRNGMYHLAYPKYNLVFHTAPGIADDVVIQPVIGELDGSPAYCIAYLVNPLSMTRTLVNHFPSFVARLRADENHALRQKFQEFYDDFHTSR